LTVSGWYRQPQRALEVVSATAVGYHSGLPPVPSRWVLIRDPQEKFAPQALLSTEVPLTPLQMITWFVQRWQVEVTFQEVRTPLEGETQRQWADLAIARTTPALFGLFTVVTLLAHRLAACRPHSRCSLLRQRDPDVCGCLGLGAFSVVAACPFFPVPEKLRPDPNPAPTL
jgi:hypothetical protein